MEFRRFRLDRPKLHAGGRANGQFLVHNGTAWEVAGVAPLHRWKLDETSGTTLADAAPDNNSGGWCSVPGVSVPPLNTWVHIAVSVDSACASNLYLNGGLEASCDCGTGMLVADSPMGLGHSTNLFDGRMDDFRFYNRALSQAEIAAIHWEGANSTYSGPVNQWKMDETSGTTLTDSVGGKNGTMQGGLSGTNSVTGAVDTGLNFDGTNDYVDVGTAADFEALPMSVSVWFKLDTLPSSRGTFDRIFRKIHGSGNFIAWDLQLNPGNDKLRWRVNNSGGTLSANNTPGDNLDGSLDDIRIYDRALTDDEVKAIYNQR